MVFLASLLVALAAGCWPRPSALPDFLDAAASHDATHNATASTQCFYMNDAATVCMSYRPDEAPTTIATRFDSDVTDRLADEVTRFASDDDAWAPKFMFCDQHPQTDVVTCALVDPLRVEALQGIMCVSSRATLFCVECS